MSLHLIISRTHSIAEMAPGSCVLARSWTIDSSVDPENFHPDDLQQCVSPPHHSNHSFPVSSLGNSIPCWGQLSAQYLRDPASAVRPKLEKCHVWMSLHVEGLLVPLPRRICQYRMSPGFSLCTKPLLSLLVLQHFAFPTF